MLKIYSRRVIKISSRVIGDGILKRELDFYVIRFGFLGRALYKVRVCFLQEVKVHKISIKPVSVFIAAEKQRETEAAGQPTT